jgi:hypothetical protein
MAVVQIQAGEDLVVQAVEPQLEVVARGLRAGQAVLLDQVLLLQAADGLGHQLPIAFRQVARRMWSGSRGSDSWGFFMGGVSGVERGDTSPVRGRVSPRGGWFSAR